MRATAIVTTHRSSDVLPGCLASPHRRMWRPLSWGKTRQMTLRLSLVAIRIVLPLRSDDLIDLKLRQLQHRARLAGPAAAKPAKG